MRSLLKLLCVIFLSVQLHAQNSKGTLTGKLTDTTGKNPIAFATITVFKAKDTSIVTYRLSEPNGNFRVPGLPVDIELRAIISSSGFGVYRKEFRFTSTQLQIDLGTVELQHDIKSLDEVLVFSEMPPVTMRNDTMEFNASAFKTLPSALVEDLLKKLPGVDIDLDGNITVNNRRVNRLLVDGKEFFGGDPAIATRNLPANLVDKVQVVDDKEEIEMHPGKSKAEIGQVINLKLKRSIKKGWFGKAYAGAGGNSGQGHYESGLIVNSFRDTFQVSVLAYSNNINRAGFGFEDLDKLGGYRRSGMNSVASSGSGGDASIGSTGQGIQRSTGAGININHDPTKKLNLSLQYFFGQIITNYNSTINAQQFFSDTILTTRTSSKDRNQTNTHRIGTKISWKIDSLSRLTFRPGITFRNSNWLRNYISDVNSNNNTKLSESDNKQKVSNDDLTYNYDINYSRSFKKKGRSVYINNNLYRGNNSSHQYNDAKNVFYSNPTTITVLNQDRQRTAKNLRMTTNSNYRDALNKKITLAVSDNFYYFNDNDDIITYEWDPISGKYEILNNNLSNTLHRRGIKNSGIVGLEYTKKELHLTPGINIQAIHIKNNFSKNPAVVQKYFYAFPTFYFYVKNLNGGYNVYVNEPSAYDMQPVVDNTNPLYQNLGNPDLKPSVNHNLSIGYNKFNNKKLISYTFNAYFNFTNNAIIRERTVDARGVQTTKPVNTDGPWYLNANLGLTKQYKFKNNLRFSLRPSFNFNYNKSFIILNSTRSSYKTLHFGGSVMWTFNWKDLVEFNQRYNINRQSSSYEIETFRDLRVMSHTATTELVIRLPKNWVWESTVDYRYNPQVAPGFSKNIIRWNAGINYLFLRQQKGQLRLYVFDILKQNTSASRFVRENYIQDFEINTLTRFFLLSFTYNIRDFKGGKVGGRSNFLWF